ARFGDPETQVILPRLKNDLLDIFEAVIEEKLDIIKLSWKQNTAVCVVMASGGYPGGYAKGYEIKGLDSSEKDIIVFHAGTKKENNKYYTNGGRVLGITASADNMENAREKVYKAISGISFKDAHYRKDIGVK
ncbi:MAG: phosphoribosylamine--glycine ligase, partial [Clostridiaceae bacterium]|nr:phosphoribosylamine--glycine ligase [Clostridiaceae bacterium]